jgi:uncharacterized membrane protein YbjE (DUF340 family)
VDINKILDAFYFYKNSPTFEGKKKKNSKKKKIQKISIVFLVLGQSFVNILMFAQFFKKLSPIDLIFFLGYLLTMVHKKKLIKKKTLYHHKFHES